MGGSLKTFLFQHEMQQKVSSFDCKIWPSFRKEHVPKIAILQTWDWLEFIFVYKSDRIWESPLNPQVFSFDKSLRA